MPICCIVVTARRPAKKHKRVYPPPALPTGQTPQRQAMPQQGRLPVSSSNCHAHDAFLLSSGRLARILDALDELSFLARGPFSSLGAEKRHRLTVLLLAHGMAPGVAWPPTGTGKPTSQTGPKRVGALNGPAICWEFGRPPHLSVASAWPMPGQPSPSQGHAVTHAACLT